MSQEYILVAFQSLSLYFFSFFFNFYFSFLEAFTNLSTRHRDYSAPVHLPITLSQSFENITNSYHIIPIVFSSSSSSSSSLSGDKKKDEKFSNRQEKFRGCQYSWRLYLQEFYSGHWHSARDTGNNRRVRYL